jgi:hypothetical protein
MLVDGEMTTFPFQADADDLNAMKAILKGLKKRREATGQSPIYIHTVRLCLSLAVYTKILRLFWLIVRHW